MKIKTISTDVLIIGSGGAGSRAAIEVDDAGLKRLLYLKVFHLGLAVLEWQKEDTMLYLKPLTRTIR